MERPGHVDQQELRRWADSVPSRTEFPRLIRRLILETGRGLVEIGVPAGDGTSVGGWDGSVRATEATAFVPAGLSLWELSVERAVGAKADKDYAKRATTPDGSPTNDCTYVAASLRRWAKRTDWQRARTAEGRWAAVRALAVDDIETWLETAPVTWAWISEKLGLHPTGLRSAESWWDSWSTRTTPATPPALVLAGRGAQARLLADRLEMRSQLTTVGGSSRDDILSFIAAVGLERAELGVGQLLARTVFVDDIHAWRRLIDHATPLVLVPAMESLAGEVPSQCGHHIVVPTVGAAAPDIELEPIDACDAAAALEATGDIDRDRADELGRLARRSLVAFRRHLANKPDLHQPPWASKPPSRTVRGTLLAGSWVDDREGDQTVLARLTAAEYGELRESLSGLAVSEDPFVSLDGGTWNVVSLYDAWLLLRNHLRDDDLTRLEDVVLLVLGEQDPALDLPEEERWKASLHGKVRAFSGSLRRGLAKTLALLGTHGEVIAAGNGQTGANVASYLVRRLLDYANADPTGNRWASLQELLPLLAEAGPDSFVDGARTGVTGDDPVLARLFTDDPDRDSFFSSSSPHTGLLWALENLAWSSEHFGAAVDLLARLDAMDPGGRLSNRPFRSLESIFTPWHPDNTATVERRLDVVDGLRKRHPRTAWRLLLSMLPEMHGVHMPTHEPRFRDWKPTGPPIVTHVEYFGFIAEVVTRGIVDAGDDTGRWAELVEQSIHLPPAERQRVVEALAERVESGLFAGVDTTDLWKDLRNLVARHREYSTADWALPSDEVDSLEALAAKVVPTSSLEQSLWLFDDHMPHLGDETRLADHGAYEAELASRRRQAIAAVETEGGLEAVSNLAERSVVPWSIGVALADVAGERHEAALLPILEETAASPHLELAHAFFARRFANLGWPWLDGILGEPGLSVRQQARLLVAARDLPKAWEVADARGATVAHEYWALFGYHGLGGDFAHVDTVARRLMDIGRFGAALDFLGIYGRRQDTEGELRVALLSADALDGLIHADEAELRFVRQHDFQEVFELLERHAPAIGEDRVAMLEWSFLPALGLDPNAASLHRFMANDPSFFVEVVSAVYRPHGDADDEQSETPGDDDGSRERRATNAYSLLSSWRHVPGLQADNRVDATALEGWVHEALRLLGEARRLSPGEEHVGKMLASAPADPEEGWPPEAVRDVLEDLQNDSIEAGFYIEVLNRRGVTSRGLEDGGAQERELVKRYSDDAKAFGDRWPRTAAILRKIANSYESEARRNEESAERFRRGLER